jgi:hypothetical protein
MGPQTPFDESLTRSLGYLPNGMGPSKGSSNDRVAGALWPIVTLSFIVSSYEYNHEVEKEKQHPYHQVVESHSAFVQPIRHSLDVPFE